MNFYSRTGKQNRIWRDSHVFHIIASCLPLNWRIKSVKRATPCRNKTRIRASETLAAVCNVLVVAVAAVRPEAVGVGVGIKMTTKMRIRDLRKRVTTGGGVYRRALAAARAVVSVTDLESSRVLRVSKIN